jgi:serine/threonine protein kinase
MDSDSRTFYLGRYNCIEQLGTGPLGETFRAKIYGVSGFEKQFAVKRLHQHLSNDEGFVTRFVHAASAFAALEHQRVARVHEVNAQGSHYYIVLDLVRGLDLRKLLDLLRMRGEALAADVAATIAVDVAEALEYTHGRTAMLPGGVLHLGLTAQSVMVTYEGELKLIDVGLLAGMIRPGWSDDDALTPTLAYLAPEVWRGEGMDAGADIFSLGVLLHELTGGARVFFSDRAADLRQAIEAGPPPPPPAEPRLQKIITRALQPDRAQRFATMRDMREALQEVVRGRSDRARSDLSALVRRLALPRERRTGAFAAINLSMATSDLVTPLAASKPPPMPGTKGSATAELSQPPDRPTATERPWAPPATKPPGPMLPVPRQNTLAGIGPAEMVLGPEDMIELTGATTEKTMTAVPHEEAETHRILRLDVADAADAPLATVAIGERAERDAVGAPASTDDRGRRPAADAVRARADADALGHLHPEVAAAGANALGARTETDALGGHRHPKAGTEAFGARAETDALGSHLHPRAAAAGTQANPFGARAETDALGGHLHPKAAVAGTEANPFGARADALGSHLHPKAAAAGTEANPFGARAETDALGGHSHPKAGAETFGARAETDALGGHSHPKAGAEAFGARAETDALGVGHIARESSGERADGSGSDLGDTALGVGTNAFGAPLGTDALDGGAAAGAAGSNSDAVANAPTTRSNTDALGAHSQGDGRDGHSAAEAPSQRAATGDLGAGANADGRSQRVAGVALGANATVAPHANPPGEPGVPRAAEERVVADEATTTRFTKETTSSTVGELTSRAAVESLPPSTEWAARDTRPTATGPRGTPLAGSSSAPSADDRTERTTSEQTGSSVDETTARPGRRRTASGPIGWSASGESELRAAKEPAADVAGSGVAVQFDATSADDGIAENGDPTLRDSPAEHGRPAPSRVSLATLQAIAERESGTPPMGGDPAGSDEGDRSIGATSTGLTPAAQGDGAGEQSWTPPAIATSPPSPEPMFAAPSLGRREPVEPIRSSVPGTKLPPRNAANWIAMVAIAGLALAGGTAVYLGLRGDRQPTVVLPPATSASTDNGKTVEGASAMPAGQADPAARGATAVPSGQAGPAGSATSLPGAQAGPAARGASAIPAGRAGLAAGSATALPGAQADPAAGSAASLPGVQAGPAAGSAASLPGAQAGPAAGSTTSLPGAQAGPAAGSTTSLPAGQAGRAPRGAPGTTSQGVPATAANEAARAMTAAKSTAGGAPADVADATHSGATSAAAPATGSPGANRSHETASAGAKSAGTNGTANHAIVNLAAAARAQSAASSAVHPESTVPAAAASSAGPPLATGSVGPAAQAGAAATGMSGGAGPGSGASGAARTIAPGSSAAGGDQTATAGSHAHRTTRALAAASGASDAARTVATAPGTAGAAPMVAAGSAASGSTNAAAPSSVAAATGAHMKNVATTSGAGDASATASGAKASGAMATASGAKVTASAASATASGAKVTASGAKATASGANMAGSNVGAAATSGPLVAGSANAVAGGNFAITSEPAGAALFVDGEPRGSTPAQLTLAPGAHKLVVAAEHHKLLTRDFTATSGGALTLTLEPARLPSPIAGSAGLKVRCRTHGELRILVDGADSGLGCPNDERISVAPGTHKIGLHSLRTGQTHEVEHDVVDGDYSTRVYVKF